jgi:hypothetical protein
MSTGTAKLAADMVAQQITQYDLEIKGLDDQAHMIQARKEAVLMMRNALQALIQDSPRGEPQPAQTLLPMPEAEDPARPSKPNYVIKEKTVTGFADAIRQVFRESLPRGGTPSDVADSMRTRGTAALYTGKTPFSVRVGNELQRLMKAGELGRRSGRYYLISEQHQ